jgi:hypothetical protein
MRKIEPTRRPIPCGDGFLCHDPNWFGRVELNELGKRMLLPPSQSELDRLARLERQRAGYEAWKQKERILKESL